jgi:hypothetical protein
MGTLEMMGFVWGSRCRDMEPGRAGGFKADRAVIVFFTVESVYDVNREGGKQPDRAAVAARILEEG